ncbi:MAG: bile acid:sodium symporter [Coriobacteriales bacterium]|nr:bile acid:sodium symporter [Coriobacteriales bacterium]
MSKLQPVWIVASALVGVLAGQAALVANNAAALIEVFLMALLFVAFSCVDIRDIQKSFANLRFSVAALAINFVWVPVFAFLLGKAFLAESLDLQIGLLMLLATPCTDWYLIFTGLSRGNVPLGASVLPMNLVLQILLMPLYLGVFMGGTAAFAPTQMLLSVVMVLVVPFAAANALKLLLRRVGRNEPAAAFFIRRGDDLQLALLCLAVVAMFASQSTLLVLNLALFGQLFVPLVVFFVGALLLAMAVGTVLHMPPADKAALLFTTSARNSPVSLAIAVVAFPDQPLIALALVIGPLIELPILAIDSSILRALHRAQRKPGGKVH